MGVPGFYRWAVRKVPQLRAKVNGTPHEVDNLYLDFNGIVHNCLDEHTKVEDEALIFERIDVQLAFLLTIVLPTQLLFIALDGVAPRAKMNQQRSRRFRKVKDVADAANGTVFDGAAEAEALAGEDLFDRNAITPGTTFMLHLTEHLYAWAEAYAKSAKAGFSVVISGDRDPGEGEHKIMEYIRSNPDASHCLNSNDADLVFLGLVSPAERVLLLRERPQQGPSPGPSAGGNGDVEYRIDPADGRRRTFDQLLRATQGRYSEEETRAYWDEQCKPCPKKEGGDDAQTAVLRAEGDDSGRSFELLSVVAIRDWLEQQFPGHDRRRLGADFVAMCCLAGNDFLPHGEAANIYSGGLDRLFTAYRAVLPEHGHLVSEDLVLRNATEGAGLLKEAWIPLISSLHQAEVEAMLESAGLGRGSTPPPYRGPKPPRAGCGWDGLSVLVGNVPRNATPAEVVAAFSKAGCVATEARKLPQKGGNQRGPPQWLVRMQDARSAVMTLVALRRLNGQKLSARWADAASLAAAKPEATAAAAEGTPAGDAAASDDASAAVAPAAASITEEEWLAVLDAAILETFGYWFSEANLAKDTFLRRNIWMGPDRFVSLQVLMNFNRLKVWCQDVGHLVALLQTCPDFETRGEGKEAMVRAVKDHSSQPTEDPVKERRLRAALEHAGKGEYAEASRLLIPEYYSCRRGQTTAEAPAFDDLRAVDNFRAEAFLQGVEWVVRYYLHGCSSWSWFFPAHYPPSAVGLADRLAQAPLPRPPVAAPFSAELQLLAVLPPQSAPLLPAQLRPLLRDPKSPLADLYPADIEIDRKPDDKEWQGIVLLPFIDEARLREAVRNLGWEHATPLDAARRFRSPAQGEVAQSKAKSSAPAGATAEVTCAGRCSLL